MNKLKRKHDLITLISKIYYIGIVDYIDFKQYIKDCINNSKNLYMSEEYLFHVDSHLALFKLNFDQHNENCLMFKVTDPNKNIIAMIQSNNQDQLDRILQGAEIVVDGISAYIKYTSSQNELLKQENAGEWIALDLQQVAYPISKEEGEFFKKIIKKMCQEQNIDFNTLEKINFKFSFKAWSPLKDEEDENFDWI